MPLRFTDRPLPQGPDATFLPVDSVPTAWVDEKGGGRRGATTGPIGPSDVTRDLPGIDLPGKGAADRISHIVSEVNKELFPQRPLDDVLEKVMDIVHRLVAYERGVLMVFENGEIVTKVRRLPQDGQGEFFEVSRTVIDHVRRLHESVLVRDASKDDRFRESESISSQHVRSVMCVPLLGREEIGAIYVDCRRREGLFNEQALRDLTFLANLTAERIEIARLHQKAAENERRNLDLVEAARIQRLLLPAQPPQIVGYHLDGSTFPCREVGGDYYDYLELPGGCWGIVLADVAGKGLPAGMLMSNFQASMQLMSELDLPIAAICERLNRRLCRILPENRFITFFMGILDPARNTMVFVNAGQDPPLLVHADDSVERLELSTLPLGMFDDLEFRVETVILHPGDVLCFYSDGVTGAEDASGEMFGDERLTHVLMKVRENAPPAILDGVFAAVDAHCGAVPHLDDITVVVLKRPS
jgi:serine phosphatase RsbU (regulator of sigma subunit)